MTVAGSSQLRPSAKSSVSQNMYSQSVPFLAANAVKMILSSRSMSKLK